MHMIAQERGSALSLPDFYSVVPAGCQVLTTRRPGKSPGGVERHWVAHQHDASLSTNDLHHGVVTRDGEPRPIWGQRHGNQGISVIPYAEQRSCRCAPQLYASFVLLFPFLCTRLDRYNCSKKLLTRSKSEGQ